MYTDYCTVYPTERLHGVHGAVLYGRGAGGSDSVFSVNVFPVSATCVTDARALASNKSRPRGRHWKFADVSCYNHGHFAWLSIRPSAHPLARYQYPNSAADSRISHADARRCQHVVLLSSIMACHAWHAIAQPLPLLRLVTLLPTPTYIALTGFLRPPPALNRGQRLSRRRTGIATCPHRSLTFMHAGVW